MQSVSYVMVCCALLVTIMGKPAFAAPATQPSKDFKQLESATVTVGDIRTRVDGPKMWTMSGIDYQGTVMAVEDSAYGTVLTLPGEHQHLGTAHFLNVPGKPGEVEKENVIDLKFFIDDKPVTDFSPKMNLSGKSFRMERKSNIRAMHLESSVDVRDGVLVETAHLKTAEPIPLKMSYPLMYAWTPKATKYLFGDDNAIQKRGDFLGDDAKPVEGREKSRWMAIFEPASGKGAVCYLTQHPSSDETFLQYTDAPKIYRKLRIMSFIEKTVPAGFEGTFQSIIGFFNANETNWEAKAQQCVTDLKSRAAELEKQ